MLLLLRYSIVQGIKGNFIINIKIIIKKNQLVKMAVPLSPQYQLGYWIGGVSPCSEELLASRTHPRGSLLDSVSSAHLELVRRGIFLRASDQSAIDIVIILLSYKLSFLSLLSQPVILQIILHSGDRLGLRIAGLQPLFTPESSTN